MESKRALPDVFLNTNNTTVSEVYGFNNNVEMGNRNCVYYVTLYNTKGNQEEEHFPFLRHCTAIAKRVLRNQEREFSRVLSSEFEEEATLKPFEQNFRVGLGHVLSRILAHLSSTIISATKAWHLVMKDSRFQFSHDFSQILFYSLKAGHQVMIYSSDIGETKRRKLAGLTLMFFSTFTDLNNVTLIQFVYGSTFKIIK
jgi:hypothetical protein